MANKKNTSKPNKTAVAFASLGSYVESRVVEATEKKNRLHEFIEWGEDNLYPQYLLSLYRNVASLRSVINGSVDYVAGNAVTSSIPLLMGEVNDDSQTISEIVAQLARDYYVYGGFAIEVVRNGFGEVASLRPLDFTKVRTDKHNQVIYYSEEWEKSRSKMIVLPHYVAEHKDIETSVLYIKNTHYQTYPEPLYVASLKSCEVERAIDEYHLNAINNNFSASYVINFNNGEPEEEQKREIVKGLTEKFTGQQNAGRFLASFNASQENATTLQKLEQDNFSERYTALATHCRQQIYTAFRANPNLFGIPTESLGFSSEEYAEAFKLYNRTQIRPVQAMIVDAFDKIFGVKGSISITPFSLDDSTDKEVE